MTELDRDHMVYDTYGRDNTICPYCGYEDYDSWELIDQDSADYRSSTECGSCGKEFEFEYTTSISWSTRKIGE